MWDKFWTLHVGEHLFIIQMHPNKLTLYKFLVNDQIDAQLFSVYLFQFSTCFEQTRSHHQENQLYQYNLWYMSPCFGDRSYAGPTCTRNGHRHIVTYTRGCIDATDSPDDEYGFARNM